MVQRHQAGLVAEQSGKGRLLHLPRFPVEGQETHDQPLVLCQLQPGRDVALVVHAGEDDLVARHEAATERARHMIGQRRHVGADDDFPGRGRPQEIGHRLMGVVHDLLRGERRGEKAAEIGIGGKQAVRYGVGHGTRHLRAGRIIQIDAPATFVAETKRRKILAHAVDGKCHEIPLTDGRRHAPLPPS